MEQMDWLERYYAPIVGGTIERVEIKMEDDDAWTVLHVRTKTGEHFDLLISRDDEQNGPGVVKGLPYPETA